MLKIITQNGEMASLVSPRSSTDGSFVQFDAISDDFTSDIFILCKYKKVKSRPYHIFFLYRKDLSESNIYELYDKSLDERIGILAPIRALCSTDHKWAHEEYFEMVAGAMFWPLIEDKQNVSISPPVSEKYDISDFYGENISALIINKINYPTFNINIYLPALFSFGYSLHNTQKSPAISWNFRELPTGKALKINPASSSYVEDGYVNSLYRDLLPFEENTIAQFLLQYQVFEMLMHLVFVKSIDQIKTEINSFSGNASDLREVLEKIGKVSKERDRIRGSIEISSLKNDSTTELSKACVNLLSSVGKDCGDKKCADLIYDVRNLVFHNFRSIPDNKRGALNNINKELMQAIPKLLVISATSSN